MEEQTGIPMWLSVITLLFMIGLVVFVFSLTGGGLQESARITASEDLGNASIQQDQIVIADGDILTDLEAFYGFETSAFLVTDDHANNDYIAYNDANDPDHCVIRTGQVNNEVYCSGSSYNEYVRINNTLNSAFDDDFTVGFWTSHNGWSVGSTTALFGIYNDAGKSVFSAFFGSLNVCGKTTDSTGTETNNCVATTYSSKDYMTFVKEGTNFSSYRNGVYQSSQTLADDDTGTTATTHLYFYSFTGAGVGAYKMELDEVAIYSRAFTDGGVSALYTANQNDVTYAGYTINDTACVGTAGECGYDGCGVLRGTCGASEVCSLNTCVAGSLAGEVAEDTTNSIAGVTSWFPIILVITAMVVLILLTVLIIRAIRGSGLIPSA